MSKVDQDKSVELPYRQMSAHQKVHPLITKTVKDSKLALMNFNDCWGGGGLGR